MDRRTNADYVITHSMQVGEVEFVLGVHMKQTSQFVTWECCCGSSYYRAHYTDNLLEAQKDFCERVLNEIRKESYYHSAIKRNSVILLD